MINDDTLFESGRLADSNLATLEATFDGLPPDPYADAGLRSRRYSRYRLDEGGEITHLPHEDFVQAKEINKAVGGVERRWEEIEGRTAQDPGFRAMVDAFRVHTGLHASDTIGVHQLRWHCDRHIMIPAPEGTHQDGFDFIGMFMVESKNLTGGEVLVFPDQDSAPIQKRDLQMGEYVVLNDKKLFHNAAPLVPEPNDEPGHWDMIVLTARKG